MRAIVPTFFLMAVAPVLMAAALVWPTAVLWAHEPLPFFDFDDRGPGDPAPMPPPRTVFGEFVLDLCGDWGHRPPDLAPRLADALNGTDGHPDMTPVRDRLFATLHGRIGRQDLSKGDFVAALVALWTTSDGFTHVFCGEPSERTIGGLHWARRYEWLQESGLAARMSRDACPGQEIDPPVHTLGVTYRWDGRDGRTACVKGYALGLTAEDILHHATAAYTQAARWHDGPRKRCYSRVEDDGNRFVVLLAIKGGAIRTFYPDASPGGRPGDQIADCTTGWPWGE